APQVEPGTDRTMAGSNLSRPAGDACVLGNDLSGRVRPSPRRSTPRSQTPLAHGTLLTQTPPSVAPAAPTIHRPDGDARPAARGSRRSCRARTLGGRSRRRARHALSTRLRTFPSSLTRSLTWDQGSEMSAHDVFT